MHAKHFAIILRLFDVVSFFRPIAPNKPSPHPSETFDEDLKCLARVNNGSRAFSFDSSKLKPHTINNAHIITSLDSVLNLYRLKNGTKIIQLMNLMLKYQSM